MCFQPLINQKTADEECVCLSAANINIVSSKIDLFFKMTKVSKV